jgi:hypothetical protein
MQCSYDPRGNSVPTILLMMQRRLYEEGGLWVCLLVSPVVLHLFSLELGSFVLIKYVSYTLRAEGIFRINAENSQEEFMRDQLNSGIIPDGIDAHCLAGLIKVKLLLSFSLCYCKFLIISLATLLLDGFII